MKGSRIRMTGVAILAVIAPCVVGGCLLAGESSHPTTKPDRVPNAWDIPAFHLKGLDDKTHRLDEWKGKVILLNFWAPWCGPCQYEIPDFVRYQERYAPRGLQVIGMGLDEGRKLRNVARTLGINYPVLVADPVEHPGLQAQWGNPAGMVPYTVVIDRDGRLKYVHRGQMEADAFDEFVLPLVSPAEGSEVHK